MNLWDKVFGHQIKPEGAEKPFDHGPVFYVGGHKAYPKSTHSQIYFYEDRFELLPYKLKIYYKSNKNIDNSRERKRHEDWSDLGLIGLLWKKDAVYTLIEYNDGIDIQKIILDFNKNANYAQGLIYKKMLEFRNKEK